MIEQQAVLFVRKDSSIKFDGDLKHLGGYRFGILRGATYGAQWSEAKNKGHITKVEEVASCAQNLQKLLIKSPDLLNKIPSGKPGAVHY